MSRAESADSAGRPWMAIARIVSRHVARLARYMFAEAGEAPHRLVFADNT